MLTFDLPAEFDGQTFAAELADAGLPVDPVDVYVTVVDGSQVVAVAELGNEHRDQARAALDGHRPPAPQPDPDDEFRAAVEGATTIAGLKAALLGTAGPGAEARRR